jgi:hypothetical protein
MLRRRTLLVNRHGEHVDRWIATDDDAARSS